MKVWEKHGLTIVQARILAKLVAGEELKVRDIASRTFWSLSEKGLIRLRGRTGIVEITPGGKRLSRLMVKQERARRGTRRGTERGTSSGGAPA